MKRLSFIVTLIAINFNCVADTVEEGDYVDVRGIFEDCDSRISTTDIVRASADKAVTILNLPDVQLIGKTEEQIELQIRNKLRNPPKYCGTFIGKSLIELRISILRTDQELKRVSTRRATSLPQGKEGLCTGLLEQLERKHHDVELLNQAALSGLFNE